MLWVELKLKCALKVWFGRESLNEGLFNCVGIISRDYSLIDFRID